MKRKGFIFLEFLMFFIFIFKINWLLAFSFFFIKILLNAWFFFFNVVCPIISPYFLVMGSFYFLCLIFISEKKGFFLPFIFKMPKSSFLIVFLPFIIMLLFLFFFNRLLFFPVIVFGLSFIYIRSSTSIEENDEKIFGYFIFSFLYKGAFFLMIFCLSFVQIFSLPFDFLVFFLFPSLEGNNSLMGINDEFKMSLKPNSLNVVKEISNLSGKEKLLKLYEINKELFATNRQKLQKPFFSPIDKSVQKMNEQKLNETEKNEMKTVILLKTANHFSDIEKQKSLTSMADSLKKINWNAEKEEKQNKLISEKEIRDLAHGLKEETQELKDDTTHAENTLPLFVKKEGAAFQEEGKKFKVATFKYGCEFNWFTNNLISAKDHIEKVYMDDRRKSILNYQFRQIPFEDEKGVIFPSGQDSRALLIAAEKGEILQRPSQGNYDWIDSSGNKFEVKSMYSDYGTVKEKHKTDGLSVCSSKEEAVNYFENYLGRAKLLVNAFEKEAIVKIDVTQTVYFTKHHFSDDSNLTIDQIHDSFMKWFQKHPDNHLPKDKPIIYICMISQEEKIEVVKMP